MENYRKYFTGEEELLFKLEQLHRKKQKLKELLDNKKEVELIDVYNAIKNSKRIYPDSIVKELAKFREQFKELATEEHITLPVVTIEEVEVKEDGE